MSQSVLQLNPQRCLPAAAVLDRVGIAGGSRAPAAAVAERFARDLQAVW
jgi:hypothetical protein